MKAWTERHPPKSIDLDATNRFYAGESDVPGWLVVVLVAALILALLVGR